jgi:hypothetical protein
VRDGTQNLRIKPCEARQLLGIGMVALAITMRYRSQLMDIRNNDVMTNSWSCSLIQIECIPASIATRAGGTSVNHFSTPFRTGSETTSIDHFSLFVERAVMAPDISKVDADCHLDPGLSAWNFRDEMLRWLFHGEQSLLSEGPAYPICRY